MNNNVLFCVTGPSGSGKTTIMRSIMDNELLSFTTRQMREGEVNGQDYLFITRDEFYGLLNDNVLIEWTEYDGKYYGLTKEELEDKLQHSSAFFICDNNGFNQVKSKYDNIVSIFLYAGIEDCLGNMSERGDSVEKSTSRLSTYIDEIKNKGQYDYVVRNIRGCQEETTEIVKNIVSAELKMRGAKNEHSPLIDG
jgi:guanylate kinase